MANKSGETVRAYRNYDGDAVSNETGLECKDPSKAIQSQKEEADINTIVRNFGITGKMPENVRLPAYGDFSGVDDYRSALDAVKAAEKSFMEIPAEIRAKFDHDPQNFLEFVENPENMDKLREMGLAKPKVEVPVTPPVPPSGGA